MSGTVLVADRFEEAGLKGLAALGLTVANEPEAGAGDLSGAIARVRPALLVVRSSKVKPPAIAAAGGSIKGIIRAGAGYDNIDLPAASAAGIAVCNCPGMNAAAVAELVFAMLLALDRRVVEQTNDLRAGAWNKKEYAKARGLKGQTLGVVGVGSIGREVIARAKAFGMKIVAHSLNMTRDRAADLGVEFGGHARADLHALAARCDAVSVHVAANDQSERMCDRAFFEAMKPGAMFVNTSRGSVVDTEALIDAMRSKRLRAGLDVFADEPAGGSASYRPAMADLPGFVGTHHVGASTDQAQAAVADEVVRIARVWKESGRWENRVN
jgi:D-3-phosphoglycerate dehydrogenase